MLARFSPLAGRGDRERTPIEALTRSDPAAVADVRCSDTLHRRIAAVDRCYVGVGLGGMQRTALPRPRFRHEQRFAFHAYYSAAGDDRAPTFWVENGEKTAGESVCDVKVRGQELRVVNAGVGAVSVRPLELCLWVGLVEVPAGGGEAVRGEPDGRSGARGGPALNPRGAR